MNILIAGASSDVGCAFIKHLDHKKEQGFFDNEDITVYCHYNNSLSKLEALNSVVSHLNLRYIKADLSLPQSKEIREKCDEPCLLEQIDCIPDYFIYLPANKFDYMRLKQLDVQLIKKEMQINLYSFLEISKEIIPDMKKKEKAGILTMLTSFVIDELPPRFMTDYIVTKYALLGATKSLISEYGSDKLKIDYIAPEMMDTHFLDKIDPRIKEMNAAKNPSGRLLKPEDICEEMFGKLF